MKEYKTLEQKRKFYDSYAWRKLRKQVYERDKECQQCKRNGCVTVDTNERNDNGRKKIALIAHHVKELEFYPELALDIKNILLVCVECHEQIHDRMYKYRGKKKKNKWVNDEMW